MSNAASSADSRAADDPGRPAPLIALIAGEASGDALGGALISALKADYPGARFVGMGGPRMAAAGMDCWKSADELSVMGLFEVLAHLPRLLRLRHWLLEKILALRPDLVIGIDAPDFNLGLERRAREAGILAIHYVSPTVWAWRQGRVRSIARATDMVMCLFPFEPEFYAGHGVNARYTGHPLADEIPLANEAAAARTELGLPPDGPCVGLLPGSRSGEVSRLANPLLGAARLLRKRYPRAHFIAPMAGVRARELFQAELDRHPGLPVTIVDGKARLAMAAADVVACASGTATLETMLVNRPMVVMYRFSWSTYWLARSLRLYKQPYFSLPNLLADAALVPELLQQEVTAARIANELSHWIENPRRATDARVKFEQLHRQLRCDAARTAARCVGEMLEMGR